MLASKGNNTAEKVKLVLMAGSKGVTGNPKGKKLEKELDAVVQPLLSTNQMRRPGALWLIQCVLFHSKLQTQVQ